MPKQSAQTIIKRKSDAKIQTAFTEYFKTDEPAKRPISETIKKPIDQVAQILGNIENFPLFFEHLEKIESVKGGQVQWHFKNGSDTSSSMVVPMTLQQNDGQGVVWKAEDGAGFSYTVAIQISEAQAGRGTIARIMTSYDSAGGKLAAAVESLFGKNAEATSKKNLQRFKAFCECGAIPTTDGQTSGREEDLNQTVKH